ncbi:unnamed protein product [Arctia plantaginis]|uniref:Uncharacterized protein n=1 Tax=Arctia plantaginis TaxID=874455 RepID=A0A8S0ZF71_ARCPL|nr:unnamed protein product [Arctia plantaginis]
MSRKVADKDIEQLLTALEDGNISEDGLEDESEDEETFFANAREIVQELEDEDAEDHEDPTYSDPPLVQDLPGPSSQIFISLPMQEGHQQYVEFDKRKLIWKKDKSNILDNVGDLPFKRLSPVVRGPGVPLTEGPKLKK